MTRNTLLSQLSSDVEQFIEITSRQFILFDEFVLNKKPNSTSWSLLECFEHLNRYNRYYNPLLLRAIENAPSVSSDAEVKSTWLGRKFIRMMEPGNLKKQKTLLRMDPSNSILTVAVIHEFLRHQNELATVLKLANGKDINRGSVAVEFFKILKLSPAEALQFVIVHQQRHFLQLERTLEMNQNIILKV
jgi:hypothetical protein